MRFLIAVAALLVLPPAAEASSARIERGALVYEAGPGEENRVHVERRGARLVVEDAGADLRAGRGCASESPRRVVCDATSDATVRIGAGDGDDTVGVARVRADIDAGAGDDLVHGGAYEDVLLGGGGRDQLRGAGGDDTLLDGDGPQPGTVPQPARPIDADLLDGGNGRDSVHYRDRLGAVTVDLASGVGGEQGENDTVADGEIASGGAGNDILRGNHQANALAGNGGDDVIDGRGGDDDVTAAGVVIFGLSGGPGNDAIAGGDGDDDLTGDTGTDRLDGGAGADLLASFDGAAVRERRGDRVSCGGGRDVTVPNALDVLERSCEAVQRFRYNLTPRAYPLSVTRGGRMTFAYRCAARPARGCDVKLTVAGKSKRFHVRAGRSARLTIDLKRRPRGLVRVRVDRSFRRGGKTLHFPHAWTIALP